MTSPARPNVDPATALVVAAGKGERLGGDVPKQYRPLAGTPVLRHAVERLLRHPRIEEVRVVIGSGQEELASRSLDSLPVGEMILGGATRRESVLRGIEALEVRSPEILLVHDAARPLVPVDVIDRLLAQLDQFDGAIPVLPVVDTLVEDDGHMGRAVGRDRLRRVQTPQAFRFEALADAHRRWPAGQDASDDAQMLRSIGRDVALVEGDAALEKLTTPEDWVRAEAMLGSRMVVRTGLGFDVHAFAGEGPLMLGGIPVPNSRGLAGHSDADVVLHAITDALLGAASLGDIGEHFPPSDAKWKGASSDRFLRHAADLIWQRGGVIDHIDCTIIGEEPKVSPHRVSIRQSIADILSIGLDQVSIKATTTEKLGFSGRREGLAAQAVANIRLEPAA